MFSKFNSIVSTNGSNLSFPGSTRMFINGNGIQTDVGQITTTSSASTFQKASTVMSSASTGIQLFPSLNAVQDGLNVQGNILGVLPGAPYNITVANNVVGHVGEIQVNFNAPSNNGGSTITSYEAYAYNGNTIVNANGISGISSPIYYTGLSSGTYYSFKVSAVNGTGEGPLSISSSSIQVIGTPGAPTITSVTTGNVANSLTINFTASSGVDITDYEYSSDNGTTWRSTGITSSPYTYTFTTQSASPYSSLTANTTYQVKLRAISSSVFPGTPSTAYNALTIPNTPISVSMVSPAPAAGQLAVTYTGNNSTGDGTVTYQYTTNGGTNWATLPSSGTAFSNQSNGSALDANTTYTVQIRANNTTGSPATGGVSSNVTPTGSATTLAAAPTSFNVTTPAISQTLSLSFTGGSAPPITTYEYTTNATAGTPTWRSASTTTTSFDITLQSDGNSLVNGTTYQIAVRAINPGGNGAASSTVAGTPAAPGPTVTTNMNALAPASYPSQANPAAVGAVWKNTLASTPSSSLVNSTVSYITVAASPDSYAYFNMNLSSSNYWLFSSTSDFSLNNSSQTITIWTQARYGKTFSFNPMILSKANSTTSSYDGYCIYATADAADGTTTCGFGIGVRKTPGSMLQSSSAAIYNKYNPISSTGTPTWYMLTYVAQNVGTNSSTFTLYVNGQSAASLSIDTTGYNDTTNNNYARIASGQYFAGNANPTEYAGYISTIRQYNNALSGSDVLTLFNDQKGSYGY